MEATQPNKELFRRVFDALNQRDFDAFADTHAEDVLLHDHDEEFHGVEAAINHQRTLFEAFPDMEYIPEDLLAEDDLVAARWAITGTHEGQFQGIPSTGEEIDIPGCGVVRIQHGEIAEVWLSYDRLGLMQQLGVIESPEE